MNSAASDMLRGQVDVYLDVQGRVCLSVKQLFSLHIQNLHQKTVDSGVNEGN